LNLTNQYLSTWLDLLQAISNLGIC
jgi:hypothetical protein